MNNQRGSDFKYWIGLAVIILILFFGVSDKQFSVLFTFSGTLQTFGFALIVIKISRSRSVTGLSRQTFICYTIIFTIRAILFRYYSGYLPFDSTGNVIFKVQELLCTALSGYILYLIMVKFKGSYDAEYDVVKSYYLIAIAFVVAIIFHPNLNRRFVADFAWAFSQYLETIALLSQFILFNKKGGDIESYTSHFIAAQAISRILSIIFWVFTYTELNTDDRSRTASLMPQYVGHCFLLAQIIHLFIMADFMYYWIKAIYNGANVRLPTHV